MIRFLQGRVSLVLWASAVLLAAAGATMSACAPGLPEPESEGARLYVQFCSAEGCHGPIPPQGGGKGYRRNQYDRMLTIMKDSGWVLPDPEQDRKIREYLERFAG